MGRVLNANSRSMPSLTLVLVVGLALLYNMIQSTSALEDPEEGSGEQNPGTGTGTGSGSSSGSGKPKSSGSSPGNRSGVSSGKSNLSQNCLVPSGVDCSWYSDCLEAKYNCGDTGYPIGYGEKFCNLFQQNYQSFSSQGQAWINAVRKCLQVTLVPVLQTSAASLTCYQLKTKAFDSHVPCYISPAPGISVCNLRCGEFVNLFNVIKSSFVSDLVETAKEAAKVLAQCVAKGNLLGCNIG